MPAYIDLRCLCENCGFEYTELDQIKRFNNKDDDNIQQYNNRLADLNTSTTKKQCPRCKHKAVIEINAIVAGVHMWKPEFGQPSQAEVIAQEEARVNKLKQMGMEDKENKGIDPETGLEV